MINKIVRVVILLLCLPTAIVQAQPQRIERNVARSFNTLSDVQAWQSFRDGEAVQTLSRSTLGDNGGNTYIYRASGWTASGLVEDGVLYIRRGATDSYFEAVDKTSFSLEQAGIIGDGVTNIRNSLSTLSAALNTNGFIGTIKGKPGATYNFGNDEITIYANQIWDGQGATILNGEVAFNSACDHTQFRNWRFLKNNGTLINGYNYHGIREAQGEALVIENITFEVEGDGTSVSSCFFSGKINNTLIRNIYIGPEAGSMGVVFRGENVTMDNIYINRGQDDDGIAFKSQSGFANHGCKNWTISNIRIDGCAAGIAFGSQAAPTGGMENFTISNLTAVNTSRAVYIKCGYNNANDETAMGGYWKNININNVVLETRDATIDQPIDSVIEIATRRNGVIDGLNISNVTCIGASKDPPLRGTGVIRIGGFVTPGFQTAIKNCRISNVSYNYVPTDENPEGGRAVDGGIITYKTFIDDRGNWDASGGDGTYPASSNPGDAFTVTGLGRTGTVDGVSLHDGDVLWFSGTGTASSIANYTLIEVEDIPKERQEDRYYQGNWDASGGDGTYPLSANCKDTILGMQPDFWWTVSVEGTINGVDLDIGDTITATGTSHSLITDFTIEEVEDQEQRLLDFDVEIKDVSLKNIRSSAVATNYIGNKLRIKNLTVENPSSDPDSTDNRPTVRWHTEMPEITNFKLLNWKSDIAASADAILPGPLYSESARIYSGTELANPSWAVPKKFNIGQFEQITSSKLRLVIPAWERCYIPRISVYDEAGIVSDAGNTVTFTAYKRKAGSLSYSTTTEFIGSMATSSRAITALVPKPFYDGWHSPMNQNYVSIAENSWIDTDDELVLEAEVTAGSVTFTNTELHVYYLGF